MGSFYFGYKDGRLRERITVRLDKELLTKIKFGRNNASDVIRAALKEYLETKEQNGE